MARLYRIEQFVSKLLEAIITFFFFIILSLTITMVIMRYGFNSAIIGGNEAMEYLFIYTTALGAAIAIGNDGHIKISFLIDKLQPPSRKFINIINYLLISFINVVMVWYSFPWILSTGYFESPVMRIPNWAVQITVPIGCFLAILFCLNHIVLEFLDDKLSAAQKGKQ